QQQQQIDQHYFVTADEQNFPVPYHTVVSSDFNIVQQQQFDPGYYLEPPQQQPQRLPPRPRSADFLERNHEDYELDDEECETFFSANNQNKSGDDNSETRIMPIRPKSSVEKYHHSKFDPYMARNLYNVDDDNPGKADELHNAHIAIPNRPPLPQEYIFRFQQQQLSGKANIVGLPQTHSTVMIRERNVTYTSDDEKPNQLDSVSCNEDPFELSKEQYQKASKLLFQRQSSCSRTLRNDMAKLSTSKKQPNANDDWNEIGLPIPNPNAINNSPVQNQSNEQLEIKFKLGLNVRTYRKPKSKHCPSITSDDSDSVHRQQIHSRNNIQIATQSSVAPYYYSDLLNEEQKIALKKKLGDFAEPPPLLSRCTALNNTRFLGTTSLTLDKKLSSTKNKAKPSDNHTSPPHQKQTNHDSTVPEKENNHPPQQQLQPEQVEQQPIYENCSETKNPTLQPNQKRNSRKLTRKTLNKANSLDSLQEQVPIETSKKKRRKRKSRENLNNASDSEIQFDEAIASHTLDRASSRKHFLKSSRRFSVSAAEYVGRSHEELILMLIQLRRKQSLLAKTCEKLRLQMDSEQKMMEIEPYRKDNYQLRFNELSRKLKQVDREYQLQMPIIETIDHMIKVKSKTMLNKLNKKKAASTSVLDRVTTDDQFKCSMRDDCDSHSSDSVRTAETPNENIEILKKQQKVLEGELDRVRGMLTHSTKQLEEKAVENARMEQEMLLARNKLKQVLDNEQEAMEITRSSKLEAELAHINKVIDDLHNRRKELNNAIENLKNSETQFLADRFDDGGDVHSDDYQRFTNEELKMAVDNAAETSLYPLYENIKKTQTFLSNNNDLNDEFFTLNINLDKHNKNPLSTSNGNNNEMNNNTAIANITTMCEFDPNKVMTMNHAGDSIVDQQLKQIYNYHQHHQQQQQATKSNEAKTVREVKRESERRKFNHHQQQQ
ncbi:hypothetical protein BLA29_001777, partial [Euroglyphus maynei]